MQSKLLPLIQPAPKRWSENVLSEHVVFHSPVRDYEGPADVTHILTTIGSVLDDIEAQDELIAERQLVTLIGAAHGHRHMSGVLRETYDALGRVEQATLLLRPMSVLLEAIAAMRTALERAPLPGSLATRTR
jgi:hypothetical protein